MPQNSAIVASKTETGVVNVFNTKNYPSTPSSKEVIKTLELTGHEGDGYGLECIPVWVGCEWRKRLPRLRVEHRREHRVFEHAAACGAVAGSPLHHRGDGSSLLFPVGRFVARRKRPGGGGG